jgi:hypothetical protein
MKAIRQRLSALTVEGEKRHAPEFDAPQAELRRSNQRRKEMNTQAEPTKPKVKFLDPVGRSEFVPLTYPVEYDGKIWDKIEVRRITTGELSAFMEAPEGTVPPNVCAPKAVIDALDAEDGFAVEAVTERFFPRRLLASMASVTEPTTKTGEGSQGL